MGMVGFQWLLSLVGFQRLYDGYMMVNHWLNITSDQWVICWLVVWNMTGYFPYMG